jgi:hypothetical protein
MAEPTIEYSVSFADDYPGIDGPHHAFFMNATTSVPGLSYGNDFIESHKAANCLIDHGSRLADFEITDEMKLKVRRAVWSSLKAIEQGNL